MALCHKQCSDCPMTVTVLVEAHNETEYNILPGVWEQITSDPENDVKDIAIILRDHGVDIASVCSHLKNKEKDNEDCELF